MGNMRYDVAASCMIFGKFYFKAQEWYFDVIGVLKTVFADRTLHRLREQATCLDESQFF